MSIDKIEQQINNLNNRTDDLKWFVGIFSTVVVILFTGLSILGGMNLNSEKESLKDFKTQTIKNINKKLGEITSPPKLELLNIDGGRLEGSTIEITMSHDKNITKLHIPYRISNVGGSWSKSLFAKIYANKPICFLDKAPLQKNYESESFITYTNFNPKQIPSGVSIQTSINFETFCEFPKNKPIEVLYVLTYGNGINTQAIFNVIYRD